MITPIRQPAINDETLAMKVVQLKKELSRIVDDVNRQNEDFDRRLRKIEERREENNG